MTYFHKKSIGYQLSTEYCLLTILFINNIYRVPLMEVLDLGVCNGISCWELHGILVLQRTAESRGELREVAGGHAKFSLNMKYCWTAGHFFDSMSCGAFVELRGIRLGYEDVGGGGGFIQQIVELRSLLFILWRRGRRGTYSLFFKGIGGGAHF